MSDWKQSDTGGAAPLWLNMVTEKKMLLSDNWNQIRIHLKEYSDICTQTIKFYIFEMSLEQCATGLETVRQGYGMC